ncbi:MAG TPA: preprotein translocase subunit SecE [Candidatus Paceibacterota bacterium]|nr:preprotein translocase subunit SecE [Candidatus Paceibacterota bacterium]HMP18945.1 preprotein translocase subunit SecE [Candidatus Paceibacterota bacterium]HMP85607.1 preprotein translocase subunit SecE [Candidatus Paceibacterota bacterium]
MPARAFLNRKNMGLINYIKETKGELKHVSWPTKRQSIIYTALVVVISFLVALYVGLFDFIFTDIVKEFFLK